MVGIGVGEKHGKFRRCKRLYIAHQVIAVPETPVARIEHDDLARREFHEGAVPLPHVEEVNAQFVLRTGLHSISGKQQRERHKYMHECDDGHQKHGNKDGQRLFDLSPQLLPLIRPLPLLAFEKLEIAALMSSMHRVASSYPSVNISSIAASEMSVERNAPSGGRSI